MKNLGEAFGRLMVLVVLACLLRAVARAAEWMGVAELLSMRQAAALSCGLVLLLWVVYGKVGEGE